VHRSKKLLFLPKGSSILAYIIKEKQKKIEKKSTQEYPISRYYTEKRGGSRRTSPRVVGKRQKRDLNTVRENSPTGAIFTEKGGTLKTGRWGEKKRGGPVYIKKNCFRKKKYLVEYAWWFP